MALPDEPRQAHRAAVHQRDAPASAIHAEDGVTGGYAHVAPEGEFETASDRVTLDGGDDGLVQQHARGAEGSVPVERHTVATALGDGLQVRARAEMTAGAGEHGGPLLPVGVECPKRLGQRLGGGMIDGVAHLRAVDGDDDEVAVLLLPDGHGVHPNPGRRHIVE